jgi:hypothetical protein
MEIDWGTLYSIDINIVVDIYKQYNLVQHFLTSCISMPGNKKTIKDYKYVTSFPIRNLSPSRTHSLAELS